MRNISLLLFFILALTSCTKPGKTVLGSNIVPIISTCKLTMVRIGTGYFYLTYSTDGKIIKYQGKDGSGKIYEDINYYYNSKGQLIASAGKPTSGGWQSDGFNWFEYDANGLLTKSSRSDDSLKRNEYIEYLYNLGNQVVKTNFYDSTGFLGMDEFTYDGRGNVILTKYYDKKNTLYETDTMEYDLKMNTYSSLPNYILFRSEIANWGTNNVTKETHRYIKGASNSSFWEYKMDYNSNGFPSKETDFENGALIPDGTAYFTYQCK